MFTPFSDTHKTKVAREDTRYNSCNSRLNISNGIPSFMIDGYYTSMFSSHRHPTKEDHSFSIPSSTGAASLSMPSPSFDAAIKKSDNRGILIDRIKIAQDTIDNLSAKVFCYENEREQLREQKDAYEKGYYKLLEENSQLVSDKIAKDALLKKVNTMGDDVSQLLKAQEVLLQKHNEQQKNVEFYKAQNNVLEQETESMRKLNDELTEKHAKNTFLLEKLSKADEDLKNQIVVLKIEKEAQLSELDRLANKIQNQEEKIKGVSMKETSLLRELSLHQEKLREQKTEFLNFENTIKLLQKEVQNVTLEKNNIERDSKKNMLAANKEITALKESLLLSQQQTQIQKEKNRDYERTSEALSQDICQLKEQLIHNEEEKELLINDKNNLDIIVVKLEEQNKKDEREKKSLKQKLKSKDQEVKSIESSFKHKQEKFQHEIEQLKQQVNKLTAEMEKMQIDCNEEKQNLQKQHDLQLFESDTINCQSQQIISTLKNDLKLLNQKYNEISADYVEYKNDKENQLVLRNREIATYRSNAIRNCKAIEECEAANKKYAEDSASLMQRLHEVEAENNVLKENGDQKAELMEKQQLTIEELSKNCQTLKAKNKENLDLIDMLNKQSMSEMLSEKSLYESQITSLKIDVENLTVALKSSQQEYKLSCETYKETIKSLQADHSKQLDNLSAEKDEMNNDLQNAVLDLNEYKSKFSSLKVELEEVSLVNTDLKTNLSLLSQELESNQQDMAQNLQKDEKIATLQSTINELEAKISDMEVSIDACELKNSSATTEMIKSKEKLTILTTEFEQHEKKWESEKENFLLKEEHLVKECQDSQIRIEKLKTECRKRAIQSHAKSGELEVLKAENISMKKELDVITELNKKLEEVNENLHDESEALKRSVNQSQEDIQILKTSYEDLLTKELSKQRSEFLLKENQLLKRLSNDNIPVIAFQSSPIPS